MLFRIFINKLLEKAGILTLMGALFFTFYTSDVYGYDTYTLSHFAWQNLLVAFSLHLVIFTGQEFLKYKKIKDDLRYQNFQ